VTPDMAFECLVVGRDPGVFGILNRILQDLSICTTICLSPSRAFDLLKDSTDLLVIDWEGEASSSLLHEIWKSGKWKKPTIVLISPVECNRLGVHIVVRKPVTPESGAKSLKSAYSRMLMNHRLHARYALMKSVTATDESNRAITITITDIGDGGIGLATKETLVIGDVLSFRLLLPGTVRDINLQVRVLWTRNYGSAGCQFVRIPPVDLTILHAWLKLKIQIKKPLIAV
jgi:hypothetical protein